MNAELLYTSAPQGLKQGSRGFCTVLSTVGMPLNIATKLESLSGYRHLYPSGTPDAAKNPVNHSHLRLSVGGRTLSILSRISDYGLDYSQRTNKLAHHIVVDTPMPPCGPAALLADPSIMRSEWDGTCANIPTPPAFPALSVEPSPCTLWESITGDAGWAGVVASAWMNTTSKPTFIVFSEDQSDQLLKLLEEAISLLPPSKRWQATFGTYVTNLPPDVDCKVRCVVAGSDEARMASARGVVINLTQPLDQPPPSESVSAARDGNYIGGRPNGPPSIATGGIEEPPGIVPEEESVKEKDELVDDSELQVQTSSPGLPPSITFGRQISFSTINKNETLSGTRSSRWPVFVLASSLLCCSILGFIFYSVMKPLKQAEKVATTEGTTQLQNPTVKTDAKNAKAKTGLRNPNLQDDSELKEKKQDQTQKRSSQKPILNPEDIILSLKNQSYPDIAPVAIKGGRVIVSVELKNSTLSKEESEKQIKENAKVRLTAIVNGKEKEILIGGINEPIDIPRDIDSEQITATLQDAGFKITSLEAPLINEATSDDFELRVGQFRINGKEIPFGLPGAEIVASVELKNQNPNSMQYLSEVKKTMEIEWIPIESNVPPVKGGSFVIPLQSKIRDLSVTAKWRDITLPVSNTGFPIVSQIVAKIRINQNKEDCVDLEFSNPLTNLKDYYAKLNDSTLSESFHFDDLYAEAERNQQVLLVRSCISAINMASKAFITIKNNFDQLKALSKQGAEVQLLDSLHNRIEELQSTQLHSILDAEFDKLLTKMSSDLQAYKQIGDWVSAYPSNVVNMMLDMRNKPSNPDDLKLAAMLAEKCRNEKQFSEWVRGDSNQARIRVLLNSFDSLFQQIELLKASSVAYRDIGELVELPPLQVDVYRRSNESGEIASRNKGLVCKVPLMLILHIRPTVNAGGNP